ncbi:MAG: hypothetical protein HOM34_07520 [Planctomycetes bacterium]|nr:hypothetical protein [Planctomycetota bacterium]
MTLIEVILALGLFALMSVFLTQTISSVLGIWQAGERRGRGDLVWAATASRFASDLDAIHLGRRGWLILDTWEASPANEQNPAQILPRLRFLARGEAVDFDGSPERGAVELAWVLMPETDDYGSLRRIVRLSQPENKIDSSMSFQNDSYFTALLRGGAGMTVVDSVAWCAFTTEGLTQSSASTAFIAPREPVDFPQWVGLQLERVDAASRRKPHHLDDAISASPTPLTLRGQAPTHDLGFVLIEGEWMRLSGQWPTYQASLRGLRNSNAAAHERGAIVWLPDTFQGQWPLPSSGRRLNR